ncbi:SET domain-containing protein [Flavitalea antarctica]
MAISPNYLVVKTSTIPGSGKGLFTKKFIPAGTRIAEYTGKVSAWKDANHEDGDNGYIYYVKRSHVIDAKADKKSIARYANDARGLTRVKGITNNCEYVEEGTRVYIHAKRNIEAGSELLVPYGPEYWQVIRYNRNLATKEATSKEREAKKKTAREKAARKRSSTRKSSSSKIPGAESAKSSARKPSGEKLSVAKGSGAKASAAKGSGAKGSVATKRGSKTSVSGRTRNIAGEKRTRVKSVVEKVYKRRA